MPMKCSVLGCRTNYDSGQTKKIAVFRFPKDPIRKDLWLRLLPNKNFTPTRCSRVCAKHFLDKFVIREIIAPRGDGTVLKKQRLRSRLTNDSYPSIFDYPNDGKKLDEKLPDVQSKIERWVSQNKISDYLSFCSEARDYLGGDRWLIEASKKDDAVEFIRFCFMPESGDGGPLFTVTVLSDMHVKVYSDISGDVPDDSLSGIFGLQPPPIINYWSQFVNLMCQLSCSDFWTASNDPSRGTNETLPTLKRQDQTSLPSNGESLGEELSFESGHAVSGAVYKNVDLVHRDKIVHLTRELHKVTFQRNQLMKMIRQIHDLASINLDVLSIVLIMEGNPDGREEMDKVYKLVDTIMNDYQEVTLDPMHLLVLTKEISSIDDGLKENLSTVNDDSPSSVPDKMRLQVGDENEREVDDECHQIDMDDDVDMDDFSLFEKPLNGGEKKRVKEERTDGPNEKGLSKPPSSRSRKHGDVACQFCKKKYNSQKSLRLHHTYSHRELLSFDCKICGRKHKSMSRLEGHMSVHSDFKPFMCNICGNTYKHKKSFERHAIVHSEEKFKCSFCDQLFTRLDNAKQHEKSHSKSKSRRIKRRSFPFQRAADNLFHCEICDKGYPFARLLSNHLPIHSDEKTFKCTLCDRAYKLKSSLYVHMRIHRIGRTHKCDLCPKKFYSKCQLRSHQLAHTKTCRFKCDVCEKEFKWKRSLQKHQCKSQVAFV